MKNKDIAVLSRGGIGVIATDTLYGVVGQALNQNTVERIYTVKKRTPSKPFIILVSKLDDLKLFHIEVTPVVLAASKRHWPGPVSIILDCPDPAFAYLHRGTQTLAFRLPNKPELTAALAQTGPLVAPSANPEGMTPAINVAAAKQYFGSEVDFYSEGSVNTRPSTIIKITPDGEQTLRP